MKREQVPTLDLHGYRVDEVIDALDRFIVSKQRQGCERVRVITGKGTGAVKSETVKYLKLGGYPFQMEKAPKGAASPNEGSLIVFI